MARKARRVRKAKKTKRAAVSPPDQTASVDNNKSKSDAAEQFQQEYAYVLKDLRQILILAAALFILLILLNILLQLV